MKASQKKKQNKLKDFVKSNNAQRPLRSNLNIPEGNLNNSWINKKFFLNNPRAETCCSGNLNLGGGLSCCGIRAYNPKSETCCNGVLRFGTSCSGYSG